MLQIVLVFIGVVGLIKRKIKVSSKREISGAPVVYLSSFYLFMALVSFFFGFDLVMVGLVGLVTLLVVIFAKGDQIGTVPVVNQK